MPIEMLYDDKTGDYGKDVIGNVKTVALYSVIAIAVGLLSALFMSGSTAGVGILFVAALASYAVGAAFGFLFCIPRAAQDTEKSRTITDASGKERKLMQPGDNSNLEQISDWLVKILVGAGLVQLRAIKGLFEAAATNLSHCLISAKAQSLMAAKTAELTSGTNTVAAAALNASNAVVAMLGLPSGTSSTPSIFDAYCTEFCLFLILYFLAVGFLTGYLITKLWLPYVMLRSSMALVYMQLDADEDRARKQGARGVLRSFNLTSDDPPPSGPPDSGTAIGFAPPGTDDPNKGKFGGKAESNGLKLTAEVSKMDDIDDDYFRIILKVTTDGKRQLTRPVTFHLHPSYKPHEVPVSPIKNEATLARAAWGAFTVGITVEDEETRLELDLAQLPGVPELFKSR